jgi:hypothetical protein
VELKALRLPEYQVRLLETLAQDQGVSVDEYVYEALLHLERQSVTASAETLALPGKIWLQGVGPPGLVAQNKSRPEGRLIPDA